MISLTLVISKFYLPALKFLVDADSVEVSKRGQQFWENLGWYNYWTMKEIARSGIILEHFAL